MYRHIAWVLLGCLGLIGCQTYQAKPLVPLEILEQVERTRNLLEADSSASKAPGFPSLTDLLNDHSPELKRARADYRQAEAVARIGTPWPNPEISVGAQRGSNLDPGSTSHRTQPLVEFGFTLPISGRIGLEDDLNRVEAEASFIDLVVAHRR
ncbi:MAG: TolC family protein, partial [Planctomycetes bacterium]|nr:TolC family protein [Planctomycetota bacterium]